jgi:hypothetical protein
MHFYEVNANTIYSVAHDATMSVDERKQLIARLLEMMACDTPVSVDEARDKHA